MKEEATTLNYRIFREGVERFGGAFADEGEHNMTICRRLAREHGLTYNDVIVFDIKFGPIAYLMVTSRVPKAIHLPDYAKERPNG
jgi:hypothetical protein